MTYADGKFFHTYRVGARHPCLLYSLSKNFRREHLENKHYHLIGICGTAMASLAGMLAKQGHKVTGSDENVYPPMSLELERLGIPVCQGYRLENLSGPPDFI